VHEEVEDEVMTTRRLRKRKVRIIRCEGVKDEILKEVEDENDSAEVKEAEDEHMLMLNRRWRCAGGEGEEDEDVLWW
jgi:hypothetical protein